MRQTSTWMQPTRCLAGRDRAGRASGSKVRSLCRGRLGGRVVRECVCYCDWYDVIHMLRGGRHGTHLRQDPQWVHDKLTSRGSVYDFGALHHCARQPPSLVYQRVFFIATSSCFVFLCSPWTAWTGGPDQIRMPADSLGLGARSWAAVAGRVPITTSFARKGVAQRACAVVMSA